MNDDAIDRMEAGTRRANEWTVLRLLRHVLGGSATNDDDDDNDGGGASLASNRAITATHPDVEKYLKEDYPLHYACRGGASLDVIKYLVEEADGDKGKELLDKADNNGRYPLHWACLGGASLDVIKYLVEEADGDKGKELLGKANNNGRYPLHLACYGGASFDVIKYLVEEADGDKGKELFGKADNKGSYPLHLACHGGASLDVIKYLVEEADGDKGKELLGKADSINGIYPLHLACQGGASLDVIKYLVEEADGDKGKELLGKADKDCMYPLHWACRKHPSLDVIKYLVEEADGDKGKELLGKTDQYGNYPLHLACHGGTSLDVIKYLVEEADGDKGKELLGKTDNKYGNYPLHQACLKGASLDVIKYLVEEADGDKGKGKELLGNANENGMYLLHFACQGGASLDVIKYLVEEADGDKGKGKELLGKADKNGKYPLHCACYGGASPDVIKYLIQKKPGPLQYKDFNGLSALDYMDNNTLRAIWGTHQIGSVADKSSDIDRLNYLVYARALAYSARQAEQPESSLCVGLNGRWGGGKSTLWKQTRKCLYAEFLLADAQILHNVYQLSDKCESYSYRRAIENAEIPFNNAVERLVSDPNILNDAKKAWREKSQELPTDTAPLPLTFLEHLAWLFLRIFCACQSCRKGYEVGNDDRYGDDVQIIQRIEIKSQDTRSRRMETNAIFFLIFLVSFSPIWIVYWPIYLTCCKSSIARCCSCSDDDIIKKEAKHIAGIITGDVDLGDGDSAHWEGAPCSTFFVIIFLQIVRAIVSGISHVCAALHHMMCLQWCCSKTNHTPTGAVKYKFVEFNAWTYQGSELLWASLMKDLWDAVEAEFGKKVVRYHRAGIALAEENQFDESHCTLTPQQKARNRKKALLMFRAQLYLSLFLFLIVLTVLITLTITNCKSINRTCLGKVVNVTNNATDIIEAVESDSKEEGNEGGVKTATIATVAAFCLLLAKVITYCKKVLPYIRQTRGDFILEHASGSTKRKDFKEELGFMGVVKTEIDYLFDLLKTETYPDKEIGCNRSLRLCVFIDDLDRCPPELVVSVLEAVILLLVDGPISVWMAIDSRIVVQCIEAKKVGVFDKANISGHEFLDKIVQLPFAIPELTNDAKKSYLDKIVDEKELDPARVLSRFMGEGQRFLKEEKYDFNPHSVESENNISRHETEYQGPFSPLVRIASEVDKSGLFIPQHDRKAVIGMTDSELIKIVAENPQHASDEHRENLCSIVLQATSELKNAQNASDEHRENMCSFVSQAISQVIRNPQHNQGNSHNVPDNPDASDDIVLMGPPPSGLYLPMLNENDRNCLGDFIPFVDGNPRRMKRIINVFNVARRITELQCEGDVSPQLTAKILKMVILLEQWPYRTAWLLQLIEDINQMSTHRVEDSRMNQFLEECLGRREVGKSWWDMICGVDILEVYRRIVCKLLLMSKVDSSNMVTKDSDPQLFEGLLQCNSHDELSSSEEPYAITVQDLRPLGCNRKGGEYETCLRSYMFNMPQAITDKVSVMMNKALIDYVGKNSSNSGESVDITLPGSEVGGDHAPPPAFDWRTISRFISEAAKFI